MSGVFDLSGRRALITGASGGIGGAIARTLHGAGASVVLAGRRREALDALADELGDRAEVVVGDVAETEALAAAAGELDILVNNAGVTRDNLAMRMKDAEWDEVLATNLTSAFKLARAVMRPMMKRRWGRIVNIGSVVGLTGNPGQANYVAAKAGLVGMSKALALELASRGITVNCVAPGFVASAMTDALDEKQRAAIVDRVPMGRMGEGADVSAAVLYLSSPAASYVTGQCLHVNGGLAML